MSTQPRLSTTSSIAASTRALSATTAEAPTGHGKRRITQAAQQPSGRTTWVMYARLTASVVAATTAKSEVEVFRQHPRVADIDCLTRTGQCDPLQAEDRGPGLNVKALRLLPVGWQRGQCGVRVLDVQFAVRE